MLVPVADPRRAFEAQRGELLAAVTRVLDSGRYVLGLEHELFESELAAYLDVQHCVGVASGTDALQIALAAIGCVEGDEIVTVANAGFYASAAARAGDLHVVYADVDPDTLTLSAATLEPALTSRTRAVVLTHLYGLMAEVESVVELCRGRGIAVVEDCAQAAGARRNGRRAGAFGDAGTFSFYPTKNLGAVGDGGAIVTDDEGLATRARALRQYGWEKKYRVTVAGGRNSRLDELQAAILRTRLPYLDAWSERRRSVVSSYSAALRHAAGRMIRLDGEDYVAHLAVLLAADRDAVRSRLQAGGIGTDVHYPIPDHRQPVWGATLGSVRLPITEDAADRVITLPCFPELTDDEVARVCEVLDEL